ncbi:holo-ACP synthase [Anaerorhabdus sp.]|uniref:holo-ACP synthase n=1 Tax=Anaerorhabdus sp. TaxID=1872524 RepID=UPI002FC9C9B7
MIVGIGCDLCKVERVDEKIAQKVLTEKELHEFQQITLIRQKEWLAGRFAAKEAIIKATGIKSMKDIEIEITKEGKPYVNHPSLTIHLSISHDGEYAMATAVAEHV